MLVNYTIAKRHRQPNHDDDVNGFCFGQMNGCMDIYVLKEEKKKPEWQPKMVLVSACGCVCLTTTSQVAGPIRQYC